jgi:hypothetical protein
MDENNVTAEYCSRCASPRGSGVEMTSETESPRLARARIEVTAAILLVAGGRFPEVLVANLPDCRAIMCDLRDEAARQGVELLLEERADGPETDVRVRVR